MYDMAKAVMTIQRAFGLIPRIIGKGDAARVSPIRPDRRTRPQIKSQRLVDLLHRLRRELPMSTSAATPLQSGSIDSMIVMDRGVDLVTPLCTQLTYEGLVDEVIGIKNCQSLPALARFNLTVPCSSRGSRFGTDQPRPRRFQFDPRRLCIRHPPPKEEETTPLLL